MRLGELRTIDSRTAINFLLPKHYSGRIPTISKAFGWYFDDELKAVCTFGKPATPFLCYCCGKQNSKYVFELNRLCRTEDLQEPLSQFVSACLRELKKQNWIIISYSDTAMYHHGYIYQACNFIYTGCTKERTDKYTPNGKHGRHYTNEYQNGLRKVRTAKHRYIYFCTYSKRLKKEWLKDLQYPVCDYPKGDNKNYKLGNYMQDIIVKSDKMITPLQMQFSI